MNRFLNSPAVLVLALVLLLTGCAAGVVTDYDHQARFDRYQSWAFVPRDEDGFLSLDDGRIETAVEAQLRAKGLEREPPAIADLLVSYRIDEIERFDSYGVSYGVGFSRRHFGWGLATAPPVREIREGQLVIELVDARTDRAVWRGASKRYLNENQTTEKRRTLIDEVVTEMFTRYPPE